MKNLIKILSILLISFVSTQGFADINFVFKHNVEANHLPLPYKLTMYIAAQSKSGAHLAESNGTGLAGDEMLPGEHSNTYTTSSIFAPDPTGIYKIRINCYLRYPQVGSMQTYAKEISIPKDGSTVYVEAVCPVVSDGQGYALNPIKDVNIKVVEKP